MRITGFSWKHKINSSWICMECGIFKFEQLRKSKDIYKTSTFEWPAKVFMVKNWHLIQSFFGIIFCKKCRWGNYLVISLLIASILSNLKLFCLSRLLVNISSNEHFVTLWSKVGQGMDKVKSFTGCLRQILPGIFLNTLITDKLNFWFHRGHYHYSSEILSAKSI